MTASNSDDNDERREDGVNLLALRDRPLKDSLKKLPCMRESLLNGIATGLATFVLTYYRRPNVLRSANWAVGAHVVVAGLWWPLCTSKQVGAARRSQVFVDALKGARNIEEAQHQLGQVEYPNVKFDRQVLDTRGSASAPTSSESTR